MSTARTGTSGARDQVNRLLALVPYLQSRGEISVADAARDFGVTPRTIRRDINVLMFCGLPGLGMGDLIEVDFEALKGEDVIRLSNAEYLTRPLRLDSTEAAALVVGLRAMLDGSRDEERELVERTLRKVEEAAGEAAGVAAQVTLHVAEGTFERSLHARITEAVSARRQVRLHHHSPVRDEVSTRVVDPISVLGQGGHTYLDAWCHRVQDRRLFRLDRITQAEVLDTPVSEHADQPPLNLTEGIFRSSPEDLLTTVRLSPTARWVAEYHPVESASEEPDGGLTVTMRVGDPQWIIRLMLRLGGTAALVEPTELAEQIRATALAALTHY